MLDDGLTHKGFLLGKDVCEVLVHHQGGGCVGQGVPQDFPPVVALLGHLNPDPFSFALVDGNVTSSSNGLDEIPRRPLH